MERDYRVFISYSHDDEDKINDILDVLKQNGLISTYDKNFVAGIPFREQIEALIAHSDVFVAILSENSNEAGWVHEEIGYAMALDIPILPIALDDTIPDKMIRELHALPWQKAANKDIAIQNYKQSLLMKKTRPSYECGDNRHQRTDMLVEYAGRIFMMGYSGKLRQIAGLSTFHLPDEPVYDDISWTNRYTGMNLPGEEELRALHNERKMLERHVKNEGCNLIINPAFTFGNDLARETRINELLKFLKDKKDEYDIEIVIDTIPDGRNLTIVGDWFAADAYRSTLDKGYSQTIFTRHAPTVRNKIIQFDRQFDKLLKQQQEKDRTTVEVVIGKLEGILEEVKENED